MNHLPSDLIVSLVARLEDESKHSALHLLACGGCRAKALSLLEDETDPELPLPDPFWARVQPLIASQREESRRDRAAAGPLYDELIGHSPEERSRIVRREPRFHSPGLVRLLLTASEETKEADPDQAEPLAGLALEIAQMLPLRAGEITLAELRTRAWCEIGDLRRMRGDLVGAGKAFRRAARQLAAESLDAQGRAILCRFLARLRKDQNRIDEAVALYGRAAVLFDTLEDFTELGETLIEEAELRHRELDPEGARSIFRAAMSLIEAQRFPRAALRARYGFALCCADLGRPAEAEEILAEGRKIRGGLADPPGELRELWIRAQVAERRSDFAGAAEILRRVIEGLIAEGAVYDAALATLELAGLYVELGSGEELSRLRGGIVPLRALHDRHRAAWETLSFALAYSARGDRKSVLFLEKAAKYLKRIRYDPDLHFHSWLKAPGGIEWDELDPALRRQLCEQAGLGSNLAERRGDQIDTAVQERINQALEVLSGLRVHFASTYPEEP
jgi:tetratricopeptide (TPR) repeat protein